MTVCGVKTINYVSKKTGKLVNGIELHCQYLDNTINGFGCKHEYISANVIEKSGGYIPVVGDEIDIYYTIFGNKQYPSYIHKIEG